MGPPLGDEEEIVYFTYERMGDYLTIEYLTNKYTDFPSLLEWIESSENKILDFRHKSKNVQFI